VGFFYVKGICIGTPKLIFKYVGCTRGKKGFVLEVQFRNKGQHLPECFLQKECHVVQVVNTKHVWYEEGLRQYWQKGKEVRKKRKGKGEIIPVHIGNAYRASTDAE